MANEENDVQKMLSLYDRLAAQRALRPGEKRLFTAELQEIVDREALKRRTVRERLIHALAVSRERINRDRFRLLYGYDQPPMSGEARMYLDGLLDEKKISKEEWSRAIFQRIARSGEDGGLDVVGPPKRNLVLGKVAVGPLILVASACMVIVLNEPFSLAHAAPLGLVLGALLGRTGRAIYDYSWGQLSLATKLRYLLPIFRLRLS